MSVWGWVMATTVVLLTGGSSGGESFDWPHAEGESIPDGDVVTVGECQYRHDAHLDEPKQAVFIGPVEP